MTHRKERVRILLKEGASLPRYASEGASGADVTACISESKTIAPKKSLLVATGISMEIPRGYEIQVRPRSGLALKHQITVLNSPGTIDCDYRGELQVILINHGEDPFILTPGMRIAQIVLVPVVHAEFVVEEELTTTVRGSGGFGHTGV